jgi:hypothetical protein
MTELTKIIKITIIMFIVMLSYNSSIAVEKAFFNGQVLDVDGKAVKGAEIFIYNTPDTRRPADFISSRTDVQGRFNMILPTGKYWAVARLRKGEKYGPLMIGDKHSGEPVEIELVANEEFDQDFIVVDIRESARLHKKTRQDFLKLRGRIIDKEGKPLKNTYAIANRARELSEIPDYISAWTDDEGHYTLYLPAGTYFIGYALEFPPGRDVYIIRELHLISELTDLDIAAEQP